MSEPEIERIRVQHRQLSHEINFGEHKFGDTIYLDGARIGQIGMASVLVDAEGRLWRHSYAERGELIQFLGKIGGAGAEEEAVEATPARFSECDDDVRLRAANNADAPYDQRTCETYPWAAAARIRHLEWRITSLEHERAMKAVALDAVFTRLKREIFGA